MIFAKENDELSMKAIEAVDSIDDNLKERSVSVVKTSNMEQIEQYDIEVLPKLIYFESEIPTFWPDKLPLDNNDTILAWVERCQDLDLIEEITEDMLEKLIANTDQASCLSSIILRRSLKQHSHFIAFFFFIVYE